MTDIKIFLVLAITILSLSSINISAQNYGNDQNVSSQTIEANVFKQILKLPYYGVFDFISFRVEDGGIITLSGKVVQPTTKNSARRRIEKVIGVSKVINNIEVLPLSGYDNRIRHRTLRTLSNGGLFRYFAGVNPLVKIIVENGQLALEGYVANRGDYNLMNVLANGVPDVFSFKNNLIVEKELNR